MYTTHKIPQLTPANNLHNSTTNPPSNHPPPSPSPQVSRHRLREPLHHQPDTGADGEHRHLRGEPVPPGHGRGRRGAEERVPRARHARRSAHGSSHTTHEQHH